MALSIKSIKAGWVNPNSNSYGANRKSKKNPNASIKDIDISEYDFGVDEEYINSFYKAYDNYFNNIENDYKSLTYGNASEMYEKYSTSGSDLKERATTIKAYLNSRKSTIDPKQYDNFMAVFDSVDKAHTENTKSFKDMQDFLAGFKTEEEYNAYEDSRKRTEKMAKEDLNVVQMEIDDLEKVYKTAKDYITEIAGYANQINLAKQHTKSRGYHYNENDDLNFTKKTEAEKKLKDWLSNAGYASYEELENALSDKKFYKEEAQKIQDEIARQKKENEYAASPNAKKGLEKFELDEAESKKNQPSAFEENVVRGFTTSSDSPIGTTINNVIYDKRKDTSWQKPTEEWTEKERLIFGAYYTEESPQAAYDYAARLNNQKAIDKKNKGKAKISESATSGFWGGVGNWAGSVLAKPLALADYLDDLTDTAAGRDTIVQEGIVTPFEYGQTVQESQSTALNEWSGTLDEDIAIIGGKGVGDLYGLVTSIAESKTSAVALGPVGTLLSYFGQAAAAGVDDAVARGASARQANLYGFGMGMAEGIPEAIEADKFLKLGKTKTGFFNALRKQGREEGLEEGITRFLSEATDNFIMQDKSQFNERVRNYRLSGMSEGKAKSQAWIDIADEMAFDMVSGYLSGFAGSAGQVGRAYLRANAENKVIGQNIKNNGQEAEFLGKAQLTPQESEAYNLYSKYAKKQSGGDFTDAQLGSIYTSMEQDAKNTISSKKASAEEKTAAQNTLNDLAAYSQETSVKRMGKKNIKELYGTDNAEAIIEEGLERGEGTESHKLATELKAKVEKGKNITANEIANLVDANESSYKTDIKAEAETKLTELGTAENTEIIADVIAKKSMGERLTTKETEILENSEYGNRVYNEINNEDAVAHTENMSASEKNLFLSVYDGNQSIEDFAKSFELVSSYAKGDFTTDYILEHRGVLSHSQVQQIIRERITNKDIARETAIAQLKLKHKDSPSINGTFDDSIIDYENKGTEGKVNWDSLDTKQKNAVVLIGSFAVEKGLDVELIADGEERGINGAFEIQGNKILIDVYAGMNKGTLNFDNLILPTFSHELVHWMKEKSPQLYRQYAEYVFETLKMSTGLTEDGILERRRRKLEKSHPDQKFTDEYVREEVIARASEDMLVNSKTMQDFVETLSAKEQKTFIDKVKEILLNIKKWFENYITKNLSSAAEAQDIRNMQDRIDEQIKLFDKMLESAIETNQSLKKEGINVADLINGISEDGTTIVGKTNLQMSERTYEKGGRDFLINWLAEQSDLTEADKKDIVEQTDIIAKLMKDIRENNELPDYARWAATDVVKDENGDKVLSVIVKNGDYAMNIDFSQVCKKRVALNAVLNTMVQSGDLNAYTLTETDVSELNAIIKKHDFEIACALCFVDSKRYRMGSWAESFCEGSDKKKNGKMVHQYGFNEMVRSLIPKGSNIKVDEFNFTNREIAGQPTSNLLSEMDDSKLDFTLIDEILEREYNPEGKSTDLYAYAKAIKDNKELRKILNPAEIISSIGLDSIRLENKELYRLINRHQGTARPKFSHDSVAYTNDVLMARNFTAEKAKYVGGVRCQSFSDFMANMVFDYVQFVSELSAKELTAHSYTKEPLFVKLFGLTGMKINMSLVPKAVQMTPEQQKYFAILKDPDANKKSPEYQKAKRDYAKLTENAGLDENGNYIWEDETFPYDIAMDIVVDPRYSANCGTIAVGISENHILKLLADDNISMVIPYHKSSLNAEVAKMRNIDLYNDYTKVQSTRFANGKKLEKVPDFDFYGDLYGRNGKEGTHDPKKTADNYLKWCDEHNYIPKFEKSRIGRRFRDNPNYYKLLIDFRVYDTDGTYREQQPVKPIYPSNEEFKDLILNGVKDKNGKVYGGLKQQQATATKLDTESKQIVNEFRDKLKDKYGKDVLKTKNSDRDTAYIDAVNNGDMETAQRLVDEAAKEAGYTIKAFHGSRYVFNRFSKDKLGSNTNTEVSKRWFFAADEETANSYYPYGVMKELSKLNPKMYNPESLKNKGKLYSLYLKFENPLIVDVMDYDYASHRENKDAWMEYVQQAEVNGNDGIVLLNAMDNQLKTSARESTVYMFKESSQAKLTDPITYDDNGKVIPLSERFNSANKDIRYSDRNSDYMDAVNRGDMEKAKIMVEDAALNAGLNYVGLHGTNRFGFTEFDRNKNHLRGAHFFTTKYRVAESYSGAKGITKISSGANRGNYEVALDIKNPLVIDCKGNLWNDIPFDIGVNRKVATYDVVTYAEQHNYDGVIFKNVIDAGQNLTTDDEFDILYTEDGKKKWASTVFAVFNSNQIKSLDPVTYDNKGKVIPLSERFNPKEKDIRYSDRDTLGNSLSNEQQEYFKDSKIRDKDGNLLVVRHGTNEDFHIFDFSKAGKNGKAEGAGFYFSDEKEITKRYGDIQKEVYLNITKPMYNNKRTVKKAELIKFTNALIDFDLNKWESTWQDSFISNYVNTYEFQKSRRYAVQEFVNQIWEYNDNDQDLIFEIARADGRTYENSTMKEFYDILTESIGYDGIIAEWSHSEGKSNVYVTFNSEQSKYTSNTTPTKNVDMRYADREHYWQSGFSHNEMSYVERIAKNEVERTDNYIDNGNKWLYNNRKDKPYFALYSTAHIDAPTVMYASKGKQATKEYKWFMDFVAEMEMTENERDDLRRKTINEVLVSLGYELDESGLYSRKSTRPRNNKNVGVHSRTSGIKPSEALLNCIRNIGEKQEQENKLTKFADREENSVYDKMGETERVFKENAKLKDDIDRLKERLKIERQVTHGNYFNENQLDAVAGHLRKIAGSTYSKSELVNQLKDVYSYIAHSKELNWEDLFAKCYDVAENILSDIRHKKIVDEYSQTVLNEIRGTRISFNEQQIQEARYRFGNKYRNSFMGKVIIANDGISLDEKWKDWAEKFPDTFDASIPDTDQVSELYDIYDDLRNASEIIEEYDEKEQTRWLAREIYNQYWNVSPIRTTADKYDKRIRRLNFEHRRAMQEFRTAYEERMKKQHSADMEKSKALVKKIRDSKDKEIAEIKKRSKERMDAYKENAERKVKIQNITANALTLNKWLVKNSKDEHIHEAMKGPVISLLNAIDFSSKRMLDQNIPTQKDISLQKALSKVKDMMVDATNGKEELIALYGHDMDEDIKNLVDSVDDIMRSVGDNEFILNKMSLVELETLDRLVKTIKHAVSQINKFHTVQHKRGIANLSQEGINYLDSLGEQIEHSGLRGKFDNMLKWNNAVPYYAFKRLGDAGNKVFAALQDGWDKLAFNVKEITDFTDKVYTSKEVRDWSKETETFDILQPDGKKRTFKMTKAQIMALHCVAKQDDAIRHLLTQGMTLAEFDANGKVIKEKKNILLTANDIAMMTGTLSERELEVANKLQEFMNTVCSEWGNEVSMKRFAVKMFTNPDYFPIKVSPATITKEEPTDVKDVSLFRLLNMSFTKSRNEYATQSIEIGNIFDIFAQHTSDMAKYNALALPVLDAYRWYSYKGKTDIGNEYSTYASLENALGKDSVKYFNTFLKDLNGSQNVARDNFGNNFFRNAKIAAVAANLRTVLLQPTSYLRASAVIKNKYLVKAFMHTLKMAKAEKYCGMAQWKALGYYDVNISKGLTDKIKHADTWYDKTIEGSMKGMEIADKVTMGYLWNACELEIRDTRKDLKVGSEEFYTEIGKKLRDVIYATQVVDSTMTRSQIMRSPDGWDKVLTAFMSEPTLSFNMLQDAFFTARLDTRQLGAKESWKKNGKRVARIMTTYLVTNVVCALVESGFDAFRDDDEEEMDVEKFMILYLKNFAEDMSVIGKIPYLKEITSAISGYGSSRTDTQWMTSVVNAAKSWGKILLGDGEGQGIKAVKNTLRAFSDLTGLSFYNTYRDVMAALDKLDILTEEELEEILDELFGN